MKPPTQDAPPRAHDAGEDASTKERLTRDAKELGLTYHQYVQLAASLREIRRRG